MYMTTTDNSDILASNSISQLSEPIIDASINFVLRGLDTGVNLFERIDFSDISGEILYHQFIAKKQIDASSFNDIFWFRCPSGSFVLDDILDENNFDILYAINYENWNLNLNYSDFTPDNGIDMSYNVIGENIDLYHDNKTIANIGVNRLARQICGMYINANVFQNKETLLNNYKELDASINYLIVSKLKDGGSFEEPLFNSSGKNKNITRCLLETLLETNKMRIQDLIDDAISENNDDIDIVYPWISLKFKPGDKIRHILTYNVEKIVVDYSNVNIRDNINGMHSDQYPNIIAGGNYIDMSNIILTDQHFLIEYEMI